MAGNRLFFPVQAVMFYQGTVWDEMARSAKQDDGTIDYTQATEIAANDVHVAKGVQDVNMTSNFTLTPIFQLGQSAIYENLEGVPTVEITVSKLLDGRPLLWHLATLDAKTPTLTARTAAYGTFQLGLWPDTEERCFWNGNDTTSNANDDINEGATGQDRSVMPIGVITCPRCYPSSLGYTINITEGSSENMTLSGNEKVWARAKQSNKLLPGNVQANTISGDARFNRAFANFRDNDDRPENRIAQYYNVMLRPLGEFWTQASEWTEEWRDGTLDYNGVIASNLTDKNGAILDPDCSVFPIEIPGITLWGTNDVMGNINEAEGVYQADPNFARIQSVAFNVALTRNDINALGYKMPVYKAVQFPVQVTTEITVVSTTDDGIQVSSYSSACQNTSALRPGTIRIAICNGEGAEDSMDESEVNGDVNGVRIYAGMQNKLTSVSFGQGGTTGGNVQATYSYQTNNDFTVVAKADPNPNQHLLSGGPGSASVGPGYDADGRLTTGGAWWQDRAYWCAG